MTLTIDIPDNAKAERFQTAAEARGLDLAAFFVAAADEVVEADAEGPDMEIVAYALEGLEDAKAGRLYTLEEVDAHMETALAEARQRRATAAAASA